MKEKLKELLQNDDELLLDTVREINNWDGSLDWLDYQINDEEFFEIYFESKDEVARAICYGDYNYMDDYVHFNAYGNLESASEYEYINECKNYIDEIIDAVIENKNNCDFDDEIVKILESED